MVHERNDTLGVSYIDLLLVKCANQSEDIKQLNSKIKTLESKLEDIQELLKSFKP